MPIPNQTVTPTQYDFLQNNIALQSSQFTVAATLAQSGLQYVVDMNSTGPEVDLVNPFATHMVNLETFDSTSQFTQVVTNLNGHVVRRGTVAESGESLTDRLNRWLWCNSIKVSRVYATISSGAGWLIDECNIETPNTCGPTSPYYGAAYGGCPPTPGEPIPNP